jgi:hypothetical protein
MFRQTLLTLAACSVLTAATAAAPLLTNDRTDRGFGGGWSTFAGPGHAPRASLPPGHPNPDDAVRFVLGNTFDGPLDQGLPEGGNPPAPAPPDGPEGDDPDQGGASEPTGLRFPQDGPPDVPSIPEPGSVLLLALGIGASLRRLASARASRRGTR